MSIQSNVCVCAVCGGSECACGCQSPTVKPAVSCLCSENCNCGESCTCETCECADAPQTESR